MIFGDWWGSYLLKNHNMHEEKLFIFIIELCCTAKQRHHMKAWSQYTFLMEEKKHKKVHDSSIQRLSFPEDGGEESLEANQ